MLPCLCLCLYQVLVLLSRFCFVPSVVSVSETKDLIFGLFFGFVSHSGHYFVRCIYSVSTRTSPTFAVFLSHLISLSLSFFCVSFSFRLTKKICFVLSCSIRLLFSILFYVFIYVRIEMRQSSLRLQGHLFFFFFLNYFDFKSIVCFRFLFFSTIEKF